MPHEENQVKTSTRLGLGFGVQIMLAAVLGISVLFGIASVQRQFRFVVEHDAPVIANARHLSKLVVDMLPSHGNRAGHHAQRPGQRKGFRGNSDARGPYLAGRQRWPGRRVLRIGRPKTELRIGV